MLVITALVVVLTMAVAVVTDLGAVTMQRRSLAAQADAAAIAGAQAIDLGAYYSRGRSALDAIPLSPARVEDAVMTHFQGSGAFSSTPGLSVDEIGGDGGQVRVSLSAPVRLPFAAVLGRGSVTVRAGSAARLMLVG